MINWIITLRAERDLAPLRQGVIAHKGRLIFNTGFYMLRLYSTRGRPAGASVELRASLPQGEMHADVRSHTASSTGVRFFYFFLNCISVALLRGFQTKCFGFSLIKVIPFFITQSYKQNWFELLLQTDVNVCKQVSMHVCFPSRLRIKGDSTHANRILFFLGF